MYPRLRGVLWDIKMVLEVEEYYVLHQVGFCLQMILMAFATDLMEKVSPARQAAVLIEYSMLMWLYHISEGYSDSDMLLDQAANILTFILLLFKHQGPKFIMEGRLLRL